MKKIIVVGAPGAGKSSLKSLIQQSNSNPYTKVWSGGSSSDGFLNDYRDELKLATTRVNWGKEPWCSTIFASDKNIVLTHSLLDSVAYTTVRLYHMVNSGSVSEMEQLRWVQTLNINTLLLFDSLPICPIIFLRGNDGESFSEDLESVFSIILNEWNFPHLELTNPEDAATMIDKVFFGGF